MPLDAELLADDPAGSLVSTSPRVYGGRWAGALGGAMLLLMAGVTLLRWTGDGASALEKAVQQPIPPDALISSPRSDLTAPDPGDNPP